MKNLKEAMQGLIKSLGSFQIEIKVDQESTDKLYHLQHQQRDLIATTPHMVEEMAKAYVESIQLNQELIENPDSAQVKAIEASGEVMRRVILSRIGIGKKDVTLRPLTKEYIKRKGNSKIGYDSGDLYRDIKTSKIVVSRRK